MFYNQIDDNNIAVCATQVAEELDFKHMIPVSSFEEAHGNLGKKWDGEKFNPVINLINYIKVKLDKEIYLTSDNIAATVTLVDSEGKVIPLTATYFVPVLRTSDNTQVAFVEFNLVEGIATSYFQVKEPGVCTVLLDKCHPNPTAVLETNLTFIVREK